MHEGEERRQQFGIWSITQVESLMNHDPILDRSCVSVYIFAWVVIVLNKDNAKKIVYNHCKKSQIVKIGGVINDLNATVVKSLFWTSGMKPK